MRLSFVRFGFLALCLGMLTGCAPKRVWNLSHSAFLIENVKPGETLEWRQPPGGGEFKIHFLDKSPCESGTTDLISKNGVASCKAGKLPNAYYPYTIEPADRDQSPAGGPRSCGGCLLYNGSQGDTSSVTPSVTPQTARGHAGPDAYAVVACNPGQPASVILGPNDPGTGIIWYDNDPQKGMKITFVTPPPATQACNEGAITDANSSCTFADSTVKTYTYTVTTNGCPNPGSTTFTMNVTPK